jgi:uncharacterized protein YdaT
MVEGVSAECLVAEDRVPAKRRHKIDRRVKRWRGPKYSKDENLRRQRLGDLRRLIEDRCGPILPDDDAGRDYLRELLLPISLSITRRIKALIEKGDKAAEKAEQFYKAAGIHVKEIKEQSEDWETIVREQCGLGRSRAYELMAIADGRTTLEKVRDRSNRSSKISHAKKSAVQRTEPEPVDPRVAEVIEGLAKGTTGDACLMREREKEVRDASMRNNLSVAIEVLMSLMDESVENLAQARVPLTHLDAASELLNEIAERRRKAAA